MKTSARHAESLCIVVRLYVSLSARFVQPLLWLVEFFIGVPSFLKGLGMVDVNKDGTPIFSRSGYQRESSKMMFPFLIGAGMMEEIQGLRSNFDSHGLD